MRYHETVELRDGRACLLRNGEARDGAKGSACFAKAHIETNMLLGDPCEFNFTEQEEGEFFHNKAESSDSLEICAFIGDELVGMGGFEPVGKARKLRHRAEFGVCILRDYWHLGIARAILRACIECARLAGYSQMELSVVESNMRAIALYAQFGFVTYGVNPKGFLAQDGRAQPLLLMRLEL